MTIEDWLANHSDARSVRGLTLGDALTQGDDEAVAELLSQVTPDLAVGRGRIPVVEFAADLAPAMDASLSATERRTLTTVWLAGDEIDVDGPAISPVLARVGFPTMRPASPAEVFFNRARLTAQDIPALGLTVRATHVTEHLTVAPDGYVYLEVRERVGHQSQLYRQRERLLVMDHKQEPLRLDPIIGAMVADGALTEGAIHRLVREAMRPVGATLDEVQP